MGCRVALCVCVVSIPAPPAIILLFDDAKLLTFYYIKQMFYLLFAVLNENLLILCYFGGVCWHFCFVVSWRCSRDFVQPARFCQRLTGHRYREISLPPSPPLLHPQVIHEPAAMQQKEPQRVRLLLYYICVLMLVYMC